MMDFKVIFLLIGMIVVANGEHNDWRDKKDVLVKFKKQFTRLWSRKRIRPIATDQNSPVPKPMSSSEITHMTQNPNRIRFFVVKESEENEQTKAKKLIHERFVPNKSKQSLKNWNYRTKLEQQKDRKKNIPWNDLYYSDKIHQQFSCMKQYLRNDGPCEDVTQNKLRNIKNKSGDTNHNLLSFEIISQKGKFKCYGALDVIANCIELDDNKRPKRGANKPSYQPRYSRNTKFNYEKMMDELRKSKKKQIQVPFEDALQYGFTEVMKSNRGIAWISLPMSQERFAKKIDRELKIENKKQNVIYSPTSLFNLMMGLYVGIDNSSASFYQVYSLLGRPSVTSRNIAARTNEFNLPIGERLDQYIYTTKELGNTYMQQTKQMNYKHKTLNSLVGQEKTVNQQVSKNTNKMIKKLFQNGDFTQDTALVLFNTLYFQEEWAVPFNKKRTRKYAFLNKETEFMGSLQKRNMKITQVQNGGSAYTYIQLPFKSSKVKNVEQKTFISMVTGDLAGGGNINMSMYDSNVDFSKIQLSDVKKVFHPNKVQSKPFQFWMPKFDFQYELKIEDILRKLGVEMIFQPNEAKLTNMFKNYGGEYVGKMVHKAAIKVNEEGAKAAAASGFSVGGRSTSANMILNQPFKFFIHDENYNIAMFTGIVECPAKGAKSRKDCL